MSQDVIQTGFGQVCIIKDRCISNPDLENINCSMKKLLIKMENRIHRSN
jgi:hypothetical protein